MRDYEMEARTYFRQCARVGEANILNTDGTITVYHMTHSSGIVIQLLNSWQEAAAYWLAIWVERSQ